MPSFARFEHPYETDDIVSCELCGTSLFPGEEDKELSEAFSYICKECGEIQKGEQ